MNGGGRSRLLTCGVAVLMLAGCRTAVDDLFPGSSIILYRRYSPDLVEISGMQQASLDSIAYWYDQRFRTANLVEQKHEQVVWHKRWRLTDRSVDVFVVDHGNARSVYMREMGTP